MKLFLSLICAIFIVLNVSAQTGEPVVVLKGFDAVALVGGKSVKGKNEIYVVRGRFKYLFANQTNKQKFEKSPETYAVQLGGECAFMRGGVPGDPDLWKVYQGKIYLFGTAMCRERFELEPEKILYPEKREKIKARNVAIVLYDGVELLDFAGPGEVFAAAQTVDGQNAFKVYTVAASLDPIISQGFVTVKPQYSFADAPRADIVVFPGGNVQNFTKNPAAMTWAKRAATDAEIAMSVCNGAFVLAASKLLDDKNATTHWGVISRLRQQVPTATILENVRFVDNGQIITTAGVSAGIDGALHVVERLLGTPSAKLTAKYMEYDWQPPKKSGGKK